MPPLRALPLVVVTLLAPVLATAPVTADACHNEILVYSGYAATGYGVSADGAVCEVPAFLGVDAPAGPPHAVLPAADVLQVAWEPDAAAPFGTPYAILDGLGFQNARVYLYQTALGATSYRSDPIGVDPAATGELTVSVYEPRAGGYVVHRGTVTYAKTA